MKYLRLSILLMTIIISCDPNDNYSYYLGEIPIYPISLSQINSEFDDYNSTAPYISESFPLCFSSNRNSLGDNFDIVYKMIAFSFSKENGIITVQENTSTTSDEFVRNESINNALDLIKTNFDELGPYLIPTNDGYSERKDYFIKPFQSYVLMFSNDSIHYSPLNNVEYFILFV